MPKKLKKKVLENWRTYRTECLCVFGGGDYCWYCGRDGCDSRPCEYLQKARLAKKNELKG